VTELTFSFNFSDYWVFWWRIWCKSLL